MKDFFKSVRKHIGKLDAEHLREQYELISDEVASIERILETTDRGLVVLDDAGRVTRSNPAARTLLGMDPSDALPGLAVPLGKAGRREFSVTYPTPRDLEMKTIPFDKGTIVYLRDTTAERARTEEELRAGATQAVRDLASGVAHEIGNPLNAISLNLQLLKRAHPDDASIDDCLAQIRRLEGILRGFLQALRPAKPNLAPGSAAEPLASCLATLKPQFEERRIRVTLDVPAALPPVAIDAAQMEQVYFNLLKNALEAMKEGDAINVAVCSDDESVSVVFRDTGAGMAPDQVVHLFEPYRTTKEHGTGLGLMISARIVHDHGGTIGVESERGRGTVFTVRLPRLERRIRALK